MNAQPQTPPVPGGSELASSTSGAPGFGAAAISERPEVAVGAAFAGAFLLAKILRRLAR